MCTLNSIPSHFSSIPEWNYRKPKVYINKKMYLSYQGNYYKKISLEENYSFLDKFILVF